jgi:transposase
MDVLIDRVAGLDVHKETVMVAVRTPGTGRARAEEIREYSTFAGDLMALRDWLVDRAVTEVVMEATGMYWKPLWNILEDAESFELMLVNPRHVKNLPGRKTDVSDASWLAQLSECGLLRGSFVPPRPIAELRDLTRYRKKLVEERAREIQRLQKVLEDAGVKLESVVSDVTGKAARNMIEALIAGERDPEVLAQMALTRMRPKIPELRRALVGRFGDHHAFLARMHLDCMDQIAEMVSKLDAEVDRVIAPFSDHLARLQTIPGIGKRVAEVVVAECGVDMRQFPTAAHPASWAGLCPGHHESAGKSTSGRARKGNAALRVALCEAAWSGVRQGDTYIGAQFRRFRRRFGTRSEGKAIFAVAHTLVIIIWHVLASSDATYQDLGPDWFAQHSDTQAHVRRLVSQLERLGMKVSLEPTAA